MKTDEALYLHTGFDPTEAESIDQEKQEKMKNILKMIDWLH